MKHGALHIAVNAATTTGGSHAAKK
jgi:hypothetical protein